MEKEMVLEYFIFKMVLFMKDNGRIIVCMGKGVYIILMVDWLMRVDGTWMFFMVKGKSIMIIHLKWRMDSIVRIWMQLMSAGKSMMANFLMERRMAEGNLRFLMERYLLVILLKISRMAKGNSIKMMEE
jgi:hypothetical protein